jgi:hypothetical protein
METTNGQARQGIAVLEEKVAGCQAQSRAAGERLAAWQKSEDREYGPKGHSRCRQQNLRWDSGIGGADTGGPAAIPVEVKGGASLP